MSLINLRLLQHLMVRFSVNIESKMRCEKRVATYFKVLCRPFLRETKENKEYFFLYFIHTWGRPVVTRKFAAQGKIRAGIIAWFR